MLPLSLKKPLYSLLQESEVISCFVILSSQIWDWSTSSRGFPNGTRGEESTCQCKRHTRHRFDPWIGKIPWRKKWQPSPVFLPGEPHGHRSLASYSLWSQRELDMPEQLTPSQASNLGLPYCRQIPYNLSLQGSCSHWESLVVSRTLRMLETVPDHIDFSRWLNHCRWWLQPWN